MALFNLFERENIYFPGCFSEAYLPNLIKNYERVLKKLGIGFKTISSSFCCSAIVEEAGYEKQARKIAKNNFEIFNEKGIKRIITSCPNCFRMFSQNYKEIIPNWDIKVEFILEPILEAIKQGKSRKVDYFGEPIVYYDSCYLARYSRLLSVPREILKLFGFKLIELSSNNEEVSCCGSCGNLPLIDNALSNKIARNFIKNLRQQGVKKIVTADSQAYRHLKRNLEKEENIEILEFSEILCDAVGVKKEIIEEESKGEVA